MCSVSSSTQCPVQPHPLSAQPHQFAVQPHPFDVQPHPLAVHCAASSARCKHHQVTVQVCSLTRPPDNLSAHTPVFLARCPLSSLVCSKCPASAARCTLYSLFCSLFRFTTYSCLLSHPKSLFTVRKAYPPTVLPFLLVVQPCLLVFDPRLLARRSVLLQTCSLCIFPAHCVHCTAIPV